ncbi:hypothetical protein Droror1_Dr00010704 [Drosera rotundifolia]
MATSSLISIFFLRTKYIHGVSVCFGEQYQALNMNICIEHHQPTKSSERIQFFGLDIIYLQTVMFLHQQKFIILLQAHKLMTQDIYRVSSSPGLCFTIIFHHPNAYFRRKQIEERQRSIHNINLLVSM